jgi:hypothetical protein
MSEAKKKRRVDWPGQQRFNSFKEALNHVEKTMEQIHTDYLKSKNLKRTNG